MNLEKRLKEIKQEKIETCEEIFSPLEIKEKSKTARGAWLFKLQFTGFLTKQILTYPYTVYDTIQQYRNRPCGGTEADLATRFQMLSTIAAPLIILPAIFWPPSREKYIEINEDLLYKARNNQDPRISIQENNDRKIGMELSFNDGLQIKYESRAGFYSIKNRRIQCLNYPESRDDGDNIWFTNKHDKSDHVAYSRSQFTQEFNQKQLSIKVKPELKDKINNLIEEETIIHNGRYFN